MPSAFYKPHQFHDTPLQVRTALGLTQKQMADRLRISLSMYRKYEQETSPTRIFTILPNYWK